MPLDGRSLALALAVSCALAAQIPLLPAVGLDARAPADLAPWMRAAVLYVVPPLLVVGAGALALVARRPFAAAGLALVFAVGMIPLTALDLPGLSGVAPPAVVATLESIALPALVATFLGAAGVLFRPIAPMAWTPKRTGRLAH